MQIQVSRKMRLARIDFRRREGGIGRLSVFPFPFLSPFPFLIFILIWYTLLIPLGFLLLSRYINILFSVDWIKRREWETWALILTEIFWFLGSSQPLTNSKGEGRKSVMSGRKPHQRFYFFFILPAYASTWASGSWARRHFPEKTVHLNGMSLPLMRGCVDVSEKGRI